MALRFTVLASGSGGNASLVQAGAFGVLVDAGLGPRQLGRRLGQAGFAWEAVHAVLLTHTHSDHWRDTTLAHCLRRQVPLYCHQQHHGFLATGSAFFTPLREAGLVRDYVAGEMQVLAPGLRCRPLPVCHDGGATFGFRFEGEPDLFGRATALGYVADLGCWDHELVGHLADVDVLALEFNHDADLEKASGRSPLLITRVLGDEGHLSNAQAADLLRAVLERSPAGRLRSVVQLHLSQHCNRPELAIAAARAVVPADVVIHTAGQDEASATLHLGSERVRRERPAIPVGRRPARRIRVDEPWLPGLERVEESRSV